MAIGADVFHEGDGPRLLTLLNCIGNETNIMDCDSSSFNGVTCPTSGVICQGIYNITANCSSFSIIIHYLIRFKDIW